MSVVIFWYKNVKIYVCICMYICMYVHVNLFVFPFVCVISTSQSYKNAFLKCLEKIIIPFKAPKAAWKHFMFIPYRYCRFYKYMNVQTAKKWEDQHHTILPLFLSVYCYTCKIYNQRSTKRCWKVLDLIHFSKAVFQYIWKYWFCLPTKSAFKILAFLQAWNPFTVLFIREF